jgi:HlyD family secretion protein
MAIRKKKSNKTLYFIIGGLLLVVIVAVVGKKAGWWGGNNGLEVEIAQVERRTIIEKVGASGMIQPETEVKLSPDVPGEITELYVEEGDSVKAGQLLLRIRPDNYQSALSRTRANLNERQANLASTRTRLTQAEAQLAQSKTEFERNENLHKQGVISDADFEQARLSYQVAQQELESARQNVQAANYQVQSASATVSEAQENLNLTSVFAPTNGIVSKLDVEQGERVVGTSQMAGTEMMRIADLGRMEVQVDVNENDIVRVNLGDSAIIDVDAYAFKKKKFKGLVTSIANTANAKASPDQVTEFQVKIRILPESYRDLMAESPGRAPFRPGMTASVDIITNRKDNVLAVPLASVTIRSDDDNSPKRVGDGENDDDEEQEAQDNNPKTVASNQPQQEIVFVYAEGKAKMSNVATGISDFEFIEITEGIEEGQEVISGPYAVVTKRLRDGQLVSAESKENKDAGESRASVEE